MPTSTALKPIFARGNYNIKVCVSTSLTLGHGSVIEGGSSEGSCRLTAVQCPVEIILWCIQVFPASAPTLVEVAVMLICV